MGQSRKLCLRMAYATLTRKSLFFYNTEHTEKKTAYAKLLTQQVSSKKLTPAYATKVLAYARHWYDTTYTTHMKGGFLQCAYKSNINMINFAVCQSLVPYFSPRKSLNFDSKLQTTTGQPLWMALSIKVKETGPPFTTTMTCGKNWGFKIGTMGWNQEIETLKGSLILSHVVSWSILILYNVIFQYSI